MHECIKFILFWNDTLHVSGGLSVHYQKFKAVHTATGIINSVVKPTRCYSVSNLFWNDTLHVSGALSVRHQEFKTVHTATGIIISVVKPTRCYSVSNLFYFGMTLYMFRAVFPSVFRSSRLYIQQQTYVKHILLSAW
jgi:hypothetical protein